MSSGYIPASGEPDPDEILEALKRAVREDRRLMGLPPEEVARRLARGRYLDEEPSPPLVAEMLDAIERGEE